jgi:hypothetical protein
MLVRRVNQLVRSVVLEVVVPMASIEFIKSIIGRYVIAWIPDEVVGVTFIRSGHRESEESSVARSDTALYSATGAFGNYLVLHPPMILGGLGIDNQIDRADKVNA